MTYPEPNLCPPRQPEEQETERGPLYGVALAVHRISKAKGWHDSYVSPDTFIANLHGEVSELWEAYRTESLGLPCDKTPDLTCAEEEIADLVIRFLDWTQAHPQLFEFYDYGLPCDNCTEDQIPKLIAWQHALISGIGEAFDDVGADTGEARKFLGDHANWLLEPIWTIASKLGVDVLQAIEKKSAYNAGRAYRHGGKIA